MPFEYKIIIMNPKVGSDYKLYLSATRSRLITCKAFTRMIAVMAMRYFPFTSPRTSSSSQTRMSGGWDGDWQFVELGKVMKCKFTPSNHTDSVPVQYQFPLCIITSRVEVNFTTQWCCDWGAYSLRDEFSISMRRKSDLQPSRWSGGGCGAAVVRAYIWEACHLNIILIGLITFTSPFGYTPPPEEAQHRDWSLIISMGGQESRPDHQVPTRRYMVLTR